MIAQRNSHFSFSIMAIKNLHNQSEEWEIINIKNTNIYVLLHSQIESNSNIRDELKITVIPLVSMGNYIAGDYKSKRLYFRVWSVEVDSIAKRVKFADYMPFEIKPEELRGKGLGSYILGKMVKWIKEYPSDFQVSLHAKSLDNSSPDNLQRVNNMYQKFNLLKAETIADIIESANSDKIESWSVPEFCSSLIRENTRLSDNNKYIKKAGSNYLQENNNFQKIIYIESLLLLLSIIFILKLLLS